MQLMAAFVPAGLKAGLGGAAGAAGGGFSLASVLQGTATVLGVVSSIAGGNADAERMEAEAADANAEQALETLQGIDRRTQTRKALIDAVGAQDAAYAASGIDLSAGTVVEARNEAYREADAALGTAGNTEITRNSRLSERAANYRTSAKRARRSGWIDGLTGGLSSAASMFGRGGPTRSSLRPTDPWSGLRFRSDPWAELR